MSRKYVACLLPVFDRGPPPVGFLDELVEWALTAPPDIFAPSHIPDIYSVMAGKLGPWRNLKHRTAVMLEVLRVLGGYESSWRWEEGRDESNSESRTPCTEEAGIFQCSGDSMNYSPVLRNLLKLYSGRTDCKEFQRVSKENHTFAIEYCARLLRVRTTHHGPIKYGHVAKWVRREAVDEFEKFLASDF